MAEGQELQASVPDALTGVALVVVMGVSGSGKTTIGRLLAQKLGVAYVDADMFHSASNVAKMRSGTPLDYDDRLPWLRSIAAWVRAVDRGGIPAVLGCSLLRRAYRDLLRDSGARLLFVHLTADEELLRTRIADRSGHFMPVSLLASQFEALEPLAPDEPGITLEVIQPPEQIVERALEAIHEFDKPQPPWHSEH